MKTEEQVMGEWRDIYDKNINTALSYLRNYEQDITMYLADCVASVCDIDKETMFADNEVLHAAHARWLFWLSYRYMTHISFAKIAKSTDNLGHRFDARTIQNGANKMSMMVEGEPIWKKRWTIIRRIIRLFDKQDEREDRTIVVNIPKELKEQIKIEIKEK